MGSSPGVRHGTGEPELLLQNEHLVAENRIMRAHFQARLRLSDRERRTLAEIGKRLGRKVLEKVACVAKPDTILAWYRGLMARKFDGSQSRSYPGRPRISAEVTELVVRFAGQNSGWGYDRIAGALAKLVIRFRTRLWATSCAATTSHRLPSVVKRR